MTRFWTGIAIPLLLGCDPGLETQDGGLAEAAVLNYQCGDTPVQARPDGTGGLLLVTPGADIPLSQAPSTSGKRYQSGGTELWVQGESALLQLEGDEVVQCALSDRLSPWAEARERGVAVRVLGHEPAWLAEVTSGEQLELLVLLDYGHRQLRITDPRPLDQGADHQTESYQTEGDQKGGYQIEGGYQTEGYQADVNGEKLRLELLRRPCQDNMSGFRFPLTARLEFAGQVYTGCGRYFERL